MKPDYEREGIKLYLGDCLEVLPTLEAGSVDAVVTDPPYGINIAASERIGASGGKSRSNVYTVSNWDKEALTAVQFEQIRRVSVNQIIFGFNHLSDVLPPTSGVIIWDKKLKNDWDDSFSDCEIAWTSFAMPARVYRHLWMGACRASETGKGQGKQHPTQKPIILMEWLLQKYVAPSSQVLDPFMGSGTTGVACIKTGRPFIGIEKDPQYFQVAVNRIEKALNAPQLFF